MAEEKQSLVDAISAELDAPADEPVGQGAAGGAGEVDVEAEIGGIVPSADATGEEKPVAKAAPEAADAAGAVGTDKTAADEAAAAATKKAAEAAANLLYPGGEKPEKKAPAPSDDPARPLKNISDDDLSVLPKGVKAETTQRFNELTARLRERTEAATSTQQEARMYASVITSFETGPENISRLAKFSRALATNTPESLEYAWREWQTVGAQLAKIMGRPLDLGGDVKIDPLADHPDLQEAVASFRSTREDAMKIVAERSRARIADTNRQHYDSRQQAEQVVTTAVQQMQGIEDYWSQTLAAPDGSMFEAAVFEHPNTRQATSMKGLLIEYGTNVGAAVRAGQLHPGDAVQRVNQYAARLGQQIIAAKNAGNLRVQGVNGSRQQQQPMRAGGGGRAAMPPASEDVAGGSMYDAITAGLGMG